MVALVLLALLAALGLAAALGLTADSRDTEYSLGAVIRGTRPNAAGSSSPAQDSAA